MRAIEPILLLIVGFGPVCAQTNRGAESLISEVASFARTGTSWRAEGVIVTSGPDGTQDSSERFRIDYQVSAPFRARFEITGGANPVVRICDSTSQWTYYPNTKSYVRVFLPQIGPCAYPINAWPPLSITLRSPIEIGDDRVTIDGRPRECKVLRGTFSASSDDLSRRTLELCVDPATKMILRYRMEELAPQPHTRTFTFSSIQRDVALDAERLRFQAPEGSAEIADINWLDPIAQPKEGVFRVSNEVTAPILISMIPPDSATATRKSLRGAVVLYAEISAEGIPQNIRVIRPVGQGLDEKAVEAVKKWRFEPAVKNGISVPVVTALAVNIWDR